MLELVNVKKYYKSKPAVDGLNMTVNQGDVLGLLGMNGAGKSTTISMIATLMKPDEGDILYEGKSIVRNPGCIRGELGLVPQEIALYTELSGMDNLRFWGRAYHINGGRLQDRIHEVMDITGLGEDVLKKKVKTYSGGMKRRLNIGAALLHRPRLVVMDEPTAGIDIVSRKRILDAIRILNIQGAAILYTGHYMDEMEQICSRFCVMDQGRITAEGSKDELLRQGGATLEQFFLGSIGKG